MFSYTDDAIVTSSPTGRHLSTVIRHPAGMPDDQWRKHADQVCQVLNELDSKAKANSLSLHLQTVGRVERIDTLREQYAETIKRGFAQTAEGPSLAELIDSGYLAALERPFGPTWPFEDQMPLATEPTPATARIAELEKQLAQSIHLTPAELQSGCSRVDWAAGLIRQLPETHEGRNSWLLNYAGDK